MTKRHNEQETYARNAGLKYRAAPDATNTYIEYEGWAIEPDALTSEAKWQICKHTYDANNFLTQTDWADGNDAFDNIWDNYATLTYS